MDPDDPSTPRPASWWGRLRARLRPRAAAADPSEQILAKLLDLVDDVPLVGRFLAIRPIRNQVYGHGAFMGAAPGLLADPRWRRILAFLMPDVFEDVRRAVADGATVPKLIPMFENNPVMCAFGAWQGLQRRRAGGFALHSNDLSGVEWDAYIDGDLVARWEAARATGDAERKALRARIVDTTVIAHASTADVMQEAAGLDQYADVRTTRKTRMGGVLLGAWLDLFGRALELAEAADLDAALVPMRAEKRVLHGSECERYTFAVPRSPDRAVAAWRRLSGQPHFAVVLEAKSLRSTPALIIDMVEELNARGILVRSVCSFKLAEVRGVSAMRQRIGAEVLPGPREILFFHFAGDLQVACDAGLVPHGQGVLFNGASLIERLGGEVPYGTLAAVIADLDEYRERFKLDIGLYVQEYDCDALAAALLSELVEVHARTFELGFAWGGLVDEACIEHDGEDRRGLGSQGLLTWVKRGWRFREDEPTSP